MKNAKIALKTQIKKNLIFKVVKIINKCINKIFKMHGKKWKWKKMRMDKYANVKKWVWKKCELKKMRMVKSNMCWILIYYNKYIIYLMFYILFLTNHL